MIVDEAQNLTMSEATLLATRFGEGTKIILNGDISSNQTDLKNDYPGLAHLLATQGAAIQTNPILRRGTAFVRFTEGDTSARHPLLPHVLHGLNNPPEAYQKIMEAVNGAKHNFALATAIKEATTWAQQELEKAAGLTTERYLVSAKKAFPALFGLETTNVVRLGDLPARHIA